MKKVIVGMSGGVDSSVTACLLKEMGYHVEGVSFLLYEARLRKTFPDAPCCSTEAMTHAKGTAASLGVSHHFVDLRDEFLEKVIEPFIDGYAKGTTPNPCILCNRHIKFPALLRMADEKGAAYVSTGHYARVKDGMLLRGVDEKKDQSYVLYVLRSRELDRLILPLGERRKVEVREIARNLNLPASLRPESQEICFVEDKNYCAFLRNIAPYGEGPVIDVATGKVLGRHSGIHLYTIGQRKRLGIASQEPRYVTKIDSVKNAVYVGPREAAMVKEFFVTGLHWPADRDRLWVEGEGNKTGPFRGHHSSDHGYRGFRASVKIRSTMKDEPATVVVTGQDMVKVIYDKPQWAPAPGQSAVFYNEEVVVGGGVIAGGRHAQD